MDSPTVYWIKIIFAVGLILGAILLLFQYIIEQRDKEKEEKKSALSGTIKSKIIPERTTVTIRIGASFVRSDLNSLRNGQVLHPFSFMGGYDPNEPTVTIKLKNEKILISGKFRSIDGKVIAEIIDNEWVVKSKSFQRNFDENGFEVIDEYEIIKFQIDYTDIYNIRIGGVFIAGEYLCTLPENGPQTNATFSYEIAQSALQDYIRLSNKVETLFLYPSDKNFGVRRK